ncbi:hypothetical protein RYX36_025347 [Vicia faba]
MASGFPSLLHRRCSNDAAISPSSSSSFINGAATSQDRPSFSDSLYFLASSSYVRCSAYRSDAMLRPILCPSLSSTFFEFKKMMQNEGIGVVLTKFEGARVMIMMVQVIAEMTNGGVDRAVECTGSIQAMISAFECVHDGWGFAVLVGVPSKDDAFKTHPMNFLNERTLKGTFYGNYKPRTDLPNVVEKYMKWELELEKFITHRIPFSEINKAFDYMLKGESIRCIIKMDE